MKRLIEGAHHVKVKTDDGQSVSFEGERDEAGAFTLRSDKVRLTNIEADALSGDREARLRSFKRVLNAHLITSGRAADWREICTRRPLSADEFVELNRETLSTPESLHARLQSWETLSLEQLAPESFGYFQTLIPVPAAEED